MMLGCSSVCSSRTWHGRHGTSEGVRGEGCRRAKADRPGSATMQERDGQKTHDDQSVTYLLEARGPPPLVHRTHRHALQGHQLPVRPPPGLPQRRGGAPLPDDGLDQIVPLHRRSFASMDRMWLPAAAPPPPLECRGHDGRCSMGVGGAVPVWVLGGGDAGMFE